MANKPNPVEKIMIDTVPIMVDIISGTIWDKTEEEIAAAQKQIANTLLGLKNVAKTFDKALVAIRKTDNEAYKSVDFFRKPREAKENEVSLEAIFQLD